MAYKIHWHTPEKILYQKFFGVVTLTDVTEVGDLGRAWVAQIPDQTVHVLLDVTDLAKVSFNITDLSKVNFPAVLPNFGWFMFITNPNTNSHRIVSFFSQISGRLLNLKWRVVHTEAEALTFLAQLQTTRPLQKNNQV